MQPDLRQELDHLMATHKEMQTHLAELEQTEISLIEELTTVRKEVASGRGDMTDVQGARDALRSVQLRVRDHRDTINASTEHLVLVRSKIEAQDREERKLRESVIREAAKRELEDIVEDAIAVVVEVCALTLMTHGERPTMASIRQVNHLLRETNLGELVEARTAELREELLDAGE